MRISTTWTYAYDGLGDRLSVSDGTSTLTTTTDDQGWPTTADSSATTASPDAVYTWNADGSLSGIDDQVTNANDRTFSYDAWGGTSAATAGTTTLTYGLDAFERTVSRTQGSTSTTLTYQGASETLVRSVPSTGAATSFSSTPGGPLSAKTGTATAVESLRDLHGDTVGTFAEASGTTAMSDEAWYSPFGEPTALAGGLPLLGYQGDLTDASTGEVDMLTRQYVPSLGRFSTRDVLGGDPADPPSLNQWVYVGGNPITDWDPNGLAGCPSAQDKCPSNPIPKSGNDGSDSGGGGTAASTGSTESGDSQPTSSPAPVVESYGGSAPWTTDPRGRVMFADYLRDFQDADPYWFGCVWEGACKPSVHDRIVFALELGALTVAPLFVPEVVGGGITAARWAGSACVVYSSGCARVADFVNGTSESGVVQDCLAENSFVVGTPVLLASGKEVPIQRVHLGTKVASVPQDRVRARARPQPVIALIRHLDPALYRMRVGSETILVTQAHPFFVAHRGWTQVRDLRAGMRLRAFSGETLPLRSITRLHGQDPLVYNFEVAETHTYFVGRSELLVHNCEVPQSINQQIAMDEAKSGTANTVNIGLARDYPGSMLRGVVGTYADQGGYRFQVHFFEDIETGARFGFHFANWTL